MSRTLLIVVSLITACSRPAVHEPGRRLPPEYLEAIEVEGNHDLGDKRLVTGLALRRTQKRGRSIDPYVIQLDADRIRGEYLREGYFGIAVQSRVERAGDAVTVIYSVAEGRRATTKVEIRGI